MIAQLQAISRIVEGKDYSFIEDNNLTREMFGDYAEVFDYIVDHYKQYKALPDSATLIERFDYLEYFEVDEPDEYIVDRLREELVSSEVSQIYEKSKEIADKKGNLEAIDYLKQALQRVEIDSSVASVELLEDFDTRLQHTTDVTQNTAEWFIPTGFDELDKDINGFQRGDELVVLYARTNQGKSWISEKIATYMTEIGFRVGYFSPEMNELDIGYRFDTLHGHISNNAMRLGREDEKFSLSEYQKYGETLKEIKGKLFITRPKTFNRKVTVSRLRQWIKSDKLDAVFIDGITYLSDERYKRGDSKTISLTNISEDLMELSGELHVPIVVVVQANRGGVVDKNSLDTPELENIRDSDGIAQNASIVYAIRQVKLKSGETFLMFDNKKMRGGEVGKSYKYRWDINYGTFEAVEEKDINLDKEDDEPVREKKEVTGGRRKKRDEVAEDDY